MQGSCLKLLSKTRRLPTFVTGGLLFEVNKPHSDISESVVCSLEETDVKLEQKVAQGSEGDVWKGHLRHHGLGAYMLGHCCNPFMLQALLL